MRLGAADGWLLYRLNFYLTGCRQQDFAPRKLWAEKARLRAGVVPVAGRWLRFTLTIASRRARCGGESFLRDHKGLAQ